MRRLLQQAFLSRGIVAMLVTVLTFMLTTVPAHGQSRDPLLNILIRQQAGIGTIGDHAASALGELRGLRGEYARMTEVIESARRDYWAAEDAGGASDELRAAYVRALDMKDMHYMFMVYLLQDPMGDMPTPFAALDTLAGSVDGGINPFAQHAFGAWADAIREAIAAGGGWNRTRSNDIPAVIQRTAEARERYIWKRDVLEILRQDRAPVSHDRETWELVTRLASLFLVEESSYLQRLSEQEGSAMARGPNRFALMRYDPLDRALDEIEAAREIYGSDQVDAVIREVMALPLEREFYLKEPRPCPEWLGSWSDVFVIDAAFNAFPSESPREWFVATARLDQAAGSPVGLGEIAGMRRGAGVGDAPLRVAEARWQAMVKAHGADRVAEVIEHVRSSPSQVARFTLHRYKRETLDPEATGVAPYWNSLHLSNCVEMILAGQTYTAYRAARDAEVQERRVEHERLADLGSAHYRLHLIRSRYTEVDGLQMSFLGGERELEWLRLMANRTAAGDGSGQPTRPSRAAPRRAVRSAQPTGRGVSTEVSAEQAGEACYYLGEMAAQGIIEGGAEHAFELFERGHDFGDGRSTAGMALLLLMGRGVDEDDPRRAPDSTFELAKTAADRGSAAGWYLVALHHDRGIGTPASEDQARAAYTRAAQERHPLAEAWCRERDIYINYSAAAIRNLEKSLSWD